MAAILAFGTISYTCFARRWTCHSQESTADITCIMLVFGARIYHHQVAIVRQFGRFDIMQNIGIVPARRDTIIRVRSRIGQKHSWLQLPICFRFPDFSASKGATLLHGANMPVSTDLGSDFHLACNFRLIFISRISLIQGYQYWWRYRRPHHLRRAAVAWSWLSQSISSLLKRANTVFTKIKLASPHQFCQWQSLYRPAKICSCTFKPYAFTIPNLT